MPANKTADESPIAPRKAGSRAVSEPPREPKGFCTFGRRTKVSYEYSAPSPAAYNVRGFYYKGGKDAPRAVSFLGSKGLGELENSPGPARYTPADCKSVYPTTPAYSVVGRVGALPPPNTNFPGPNRYRIPELIGQRVPFSTKRSAPMYSFCSGPLGSAKDRRDIFTPKRTPGPAGYQIVQCNAYKHRSPEFSMRGGAGREGTNISSTGPGPAAYDVRPPYLKSIHEPPRFSFGVRHAEVEYPIANML